MLVYAGRLSVEKNVELLPQVLHELGFSRHDYRLVIAGAGPLADSLAENCAAGTCQNDVLAASRPG